MLKCVFRIYPESIRWYLVKKKLEKAESELQRIAKFNKKPMIEDKLECPEEKQVASFKDLFSTPELNFVLYLVGILLLIYAWYTVKISFKLNIFLCSVFPCSVSPRIVESAVYFGISFGTGNLGFNIYLNFFIINSMELPSSVIAGFAVNR